MHLRAAAHAVGSRRPGQWQQGPRHGSSGHAGSHLRKFFDKVMKDGSARFDASSDGPKFMAAVLEYDDHVDLLYRLTSPKVR